MNTRKAYLTDLTEAEWELIMPYFPPPSREGRPRKHSTREIVCAIFYLLRTGCQWEMIPNDFPKWKTVYHYYRLWRWNGLWEKIYQVLHQKYRVQVGREAEPTAAIIDSQSVKTTEAGGERGYDAGKKINGRKRHLLVDTLGFPLVVKVHAANIQDRDGAVEVLAKAQNKYKELSLVWADGGYSGKLVEWVKEYLGLNLEIVKRSDDVKGFEVLPRRWVVERTHGWVGRNRRMSKEYERLPENSEANIYLAMIRLLLKRLTKL
jgi:putative transposase